MRMNDIELSMNVSHIPAERYDFIYVGPEDEDKWPLTFVNGLFRIETRPVHKESQKVPKDGILHTR